VSNPYSHIKPPHGRMKAPSSPTPRKPYTPVGAPGEILVEHTPIPEAPRTGDTNRLDQEAVLQYLWEREKRAEKHRPEEDDDLERFQKKVARIQKWGWVWGVFGFIGAVFSLGVAYAVFIGENATDTEVRDAIDEATKAHNGGIDPDAIDPSTHEPLGSHPDMREAVETNTKALKEVAEEVLPRIEGTQQKMDKRTEYQFEFSRWQADVTERERQHKRPPKKPPRLEQLETELMLGKYD